MLINGIDYPESLVDAMKNNKLVIFAGAGVSMGEPTKLPSFNKLTDEISELINTPKNEGVPDDQYLGKVKNLGHDVHADVCDILNKKDLKSNKYHKILTKCFLDKNLRIVTTNYDVMFEQILEKNKREFKIFSNPAFPYGNDFNGIVHLHGIVNEPKNIILTDSDFGKSYMLDGNVSKFLKELFESDYVILFVGYSYNDIVMKYFTRSLPDLSGSKRYIFSTEDMIDDYKHLGMTPILYKKDNYEQLYKSISRLSSLVLRDGNKWIIRINDITEKNPINLDEEFRFEIMEILNNIHYTNYFFERINGSEWASYLFNEGLLDEIFTEGKLNDISLKKTEWLCNNILITDTNLFIKFYQEKKFCLNINMQYQILRTIFNREIDIEKIKILINLIDFTKLNYYSLIGLLDLCCKYSLELEYVAGEILSAILKFKIKIKYQDMISIDFIFDEYNLPLIWNKYKTFSNKYNLKILNAIAMELHSLEKFKSIGINIDDFIFSSFYKNEDDYISSKDSFMFIMKKLLLGLNKENKNYWIKNYISSNIKILTKSALLLLEKSSEIPKSEKLQILKNNRIKIVDLDYKEELFYLYKNIFPDLNNNEKKVFLDDLMHEEKLNEKFSDKTYYYQKYNLLIWLEKCDKDNQDIKKYIKMILNKYPYFKPRENPELIVGESITIWGDAPLPYTEKEIINNIEELFDEFLIYSGDGFENAERFTLIKTIENICIKYLEFRNRLISLLLINNEMQNDIWKSVINSLHKLEVSNKELINILDDIFILPLIDRFCFEFSFSFFSIINACKKIDCIVLDYLFNKLKTLWRYSENIDISMEGGNYLSKALNTSKGCIAYSVIKLISLSVQDNEKKILDKKFKDFLCEIMEDNDYAFTNVVIIGNASLLYSLDKDWSRKHILSKFNTSDKELLNIIWYGFLYQSYLYPELAEAMENKFHKAIRDIEIFNNDLRKNMIESYVSLIINYSDNPIKDYIPNIFHDDVPKENIGIFYSRLSYYVKLLDKEGKRRLFNNWILDFLINRTKNYPIKTTDYEKNLILKFLINFPEEINSIDDIINNLDKDFIIDNNILSSLLFKVEVTRSNSEVINIVFTKITDQMKNNTENNIPFFIADELKNIFEKILEFNLNTRKLEENIRFIGIIK